MPDKVRRIGRFTGCFAFTLFTCTITTWFRTKVTLVLYGSPRDFEDAYRWLFNSMVADKATHKKIESALTKLAQKMPNSVVERARLPM